MIWVAWRQQRVPILVTLGLVLLMSVVLVYVRADVVSLGQDLTTISDRYNQFLNYYVLAMLALPPLLGMFLGAPLFAREIEQGTHIFGLTQSVGRRRWMATKLLMAGGSLAALMFGYGLIAAWALEPVSWVMAGRLNAPMFETQGVTVAVYALTAFVIGATAGLLLRNTLAAMVLTLVVYTALVLTVANEVRPAYASPNRFESPVGVQQSRQLESSESWLVGYGYLDANGKEVANSPIECAKSMEGGGDCVPDSRVVTVYSEVHLPGQFWRFQLTELALFLVLSTGVLALGLWASRRRLT